MVFEEDIKYWVHLDNETKKINDELKLIKSNKLEVEKNINLYIHRNNLTNATVKISDGLLKFTQSNYAKPLTFKYVKECMYELIKNEDQVNEIMEYIKNKRNIKINNEIKRIYN